MQDKNIQHNIIMEGRKILNITGVKEIDSFDENCIVVNTIMGELTVKGKDFNMSNLSVDTGELYLTGEVSALYYNVSKEKSSILSKIFK